MSLLGSLRSYWFWIAVSIAIVVIVNIFYSPKDREFYTPNRDAGVSSREDRDPQEPDVCISNREDRDPHEPEVCISNREERIPIRYQPEGPPPYRPFPHSRSRGEEICCRVMEELTGLPFDTVRPDFLRNPETGRNLEIDCYNDQLKIGVEYNGIQHYVYPNFTGQTYEQFIAQARRDQYKIRACDENGVYLIVVPYTVPNERIRDYIIEKLQPILASSNSSHE